MKTVVCVKNIQYYGDKPNEYSTWDLTIGKSYSAFNSAQEGWYFIMNDIGLLSVINKDWFIDISKHREVQLNKIGI